MAAARLCGRCFFCFVRELKQGKGLSASFSGKKAESLFCGSLSVWAKDSVAFFVAVKYEALPLSTLCRFVGLRCLQSTFFWAFGAQPIKFRRAFILPFLSMGYKPGRSLYGVLRMKPKSPAVRPYGCLQGFIMLWVKGGQGEVYGVCPA